MPRGYMPSRETLFSGEVGAALQHNLAGIMVWEIWTLYGDDTNFECVLTPSYFLS